MMQVLHAMQSCTHVTLPQSCCNSVCRRMRCADGCAGSALQRPHLLGDAADRADIRYNAACAAALAGQHSTAQQLLTYLAAGGTLSAADMATDEDVASIRGQQWFQELLCGLQAT